MTITQNSSFNLDADARKFSFTVSFLILPEITLDLMVEAPFPFTITKVIANCDSGTYSYTIATAGSPINDLENVPVNSGSDVETLCNSGGEVSETDRVQIQFTNVAVGTNLAVVQIFATRTFTQS